MGFKQMVVLAIVALVGITFLEVSEAQVAEKFVEYGLNCSANTSAVNQCNATLYLSCYVLDNTTDEGICGCQDPMIRDHEQNKCVMPVLPENANATCWQHISDGGYPTPCTNNSFCVQPVKNETGKCQCNFGYIPTAFGECKLTHESGIECGKQTDCNINAFLTCGPNKTCICDQELAIWDIQTLKCAGISGGPCNNVTGPLARPCAVGSNTECSAASTCTCKTGFESTPDGTCLKGFNQACTSDSECNTMFTCQAVSNTTTVCKCPLNSIFEDNACKLLAGVTCVIDHLEQQCSKYSTCMNTTNNITVCQCDAKYSATNDRLCRPDYGGQCSAAVDMQCNADKYLECLDGGTCACATNYEFLEDRCQGYIGQSCQDTNNCIGISECITANANATCQCPGSSTASTDKKTCYLNYAQTCNSDIPCNPEKYLSCDSVNSTCGCDNPNVFVYQRDTCLIKSGNVCGNEGANVGRNCVADSTCSATGTCECNQGYSTDSFGQCLRSTVNNGAGNLQASVTFVILFISIFMIFSKHQ